jgi:hypothetical protein
LAFGRGIQPLRPARRCKIRKIFTTADQEPRDAGIGRGKP